MFEWGLWVVLLIYIPGRRIPNGERNPTHADFGPRIVRALHTHDGTEEEGFTERQGKERSIRCAMYDIFRISAFVG